MSEANPPKRTDNASRQSRARRARRARRMRRRRQIQRLVMALIVVTLVIVVVCLIAGNRNPEEEAQNPQVNLAGTGDPMTTAAQQTISTTTEASPMVPTWMTFPEDRELTAQQYFVYSCDSDRFLTVSGSLDERIYPASITKLFTAYVALQYLNPEDKITAGDALDLVYPGSSVAEIEKGDVLTVEKLVEAMLLPSGNDAAYLLAAEAGRILDGNPGESASAAVNSFVAKMNSQARELGMTGTNFANPDGIHSDSHYTTFKDLAVMGKLALENHTIMKYAGTSHDHVTLDGGCEKDWKNTNVLIDPDSEYYCPYAVGLKTGQTPYAGSCLLSAFEYHGQTFLIGVFCCPEVEDRFADTLQLFNEALKSVS